MDQRASYGGRNESDVDLFLRLVMLAYFRVEEARPIRQTPELPWMVENEMRQAWSQDSASTTYCLALLNSIKAVSYTHLDVYKRQL